MNTIKFFTLVSLFIIYHFGNAQEQLIKGLITTDDGLPFAGAIVKNLNTTNQVQANFDGLYEINANIGDTLKFLGSEKIADCYEALHRTVNNYSNLDVQLLTKLQAEQILCKEKPKELYVFIGKLKGSENDDSYHECYINPNVTITADFQIIEEFYGSLNLETITFKDYDHASIVPFPYLNTEISLLFVEKFCDVYYLRSSRKIYQTKNGQWALTYNTENYLNIKDSSSYLQAIPFNNDTKFKGRFDPNSRYSEFFMEPYYQHKNKFLIPLMGNYVRDYVAIWIQNQSVYKNSIVKE